MSCETTAQTRVRATSEQVAADLQGEVVILDMRSGKYFGLSAVGARVWQLLQEPRTVGDIRDTLLAEYEVEAQRCEADLLALICKLRERGLVEGVDGPAE